MIIYVRILDWTATDGAVACVFVDECHKDRYHFDLEKRVEAARLWGVAQRLEKKVLGSRIRLYSMVRVTFDGKGSQ